MKKEPHKRLDLFWGEEEQGSAADIRRQADGAERTL